MKVTIHNLNEATGQDVFDTISIHLLTQKKRSMRYSKNTCAYRSEEGLLCAAGCLIPLEDYSEKYECRAWEELVEYGFLPGNHQDLIAIFQMIHDSSHPRGWHIRIEQLAEDEKFIISSEIQSLIDSYESHNP